MLRNVDAEFLHQPRRKAASAAVNPLLAFFTKDGGARPVVFSDTQDMRPLIPRVPNRAVFALFSRAPSSLRQSIEAATPAAGAMTEANPSGMRLT